MRDDRFEFEAVRPGAYVLRAIAVTEFANTWTVEGALFVTPYPPNPDRSIETKPTWWAETAVRVDADGQVPEEVVLNAQRGLQIRGRLSWDGASPPPDVLEHHQNAGCCVSSQSGGSRQKYGSAG